MPVYTNKPVDPNKHVRLAYWAAIKRRRGLESALELVGVAGIALMRAVDGFQKSRRWKLSGKPKGKFSSYCSKCMFNEISSWHRLERRAFHRVLYRRWRGKKWQVHISTSRFSDLGWSFIRGTDPALAAPDATASMGAPGVILEDQINVMLGCLNSRQRFVIEQRFGLNCHEPQTLLAVGEMLGITKERVRQIQSISLRKLRKHCQAQLNEISE